MRAVWVQAKGMSSHALEVHSFLIFKTKWNETSGHQEYLRTLYPHSRLGTSQVHKGRRHEDLTPGGVALHRQPWHHWETVEMQNPWLPHIPAESDSVL